MKRRARGRRTVLLIRTTSAQVEREERDGGRPPGIRWQTAKAIVIRSGTDYTWVRMRRCLG